MWSRNKHIIFKFFLVVLAELAVIKATELFSKYIVTIHHTTFSYIVCGSFLALLVVTIYDRIVAKSKSKIKKEIEEVADVALKRYEYREKNK